MRCAVFNCKENNNKGKPNVRFYCFPKDPVLRKQWIHFCRRKDNMNPNTARICSAHFTADDIERNLQFEMGLCKNYEFKLKKGTFPTIKANKQATAVPSTRDIRMQVRARKNMIATLLAAKPVPNDEPEAMTEETQIIEPTNNIQIIPEDNNVEELNQTIIMLKQELEDLRKEMCIIAEKESTYQKQILSLQRKLQKSEFERLNMEKRLQKTLTAGQVNKLKNGTNRRQWSDADIARSITLHSTSAKVYKLLRKQD